MPTYEYECKRHGVFELFRSMSEASQGAACPSCRRRAVRILSLPNVAQIGRTDRIAHDRNEQSRHEPKVVTRGKKREDSAPRGFRAASHGRPWALEHG